MKKIQFQLSDERFEEITKAAEQREMPVSALLRQLILTYLYTGKETNG